jgi:hypothetical protein
MVRDMLNSHENRGSAMEIKKKTFLIVYLFLNFSTTHSSFAPLRSNSEGVLRARRNIIAEVFKSGNHNNEAGRLSDIINEYASLARYPSCVQGANNYVNEDFGKNYYVSIAEGKKITVFNLNTLCAKYIYRKKLTGNFKLVCLSPDEKFVSVACESTRPNKRFGAFAESPFDRRFEEQEKYFESLARVTDMFKRVSLFMMYLSGFCYTRDLVLKTISLEDENFYHEKLISWTSSNVCHELLAFWYDSRGAICGEYNIKACRNAYEQSNHANCDICSQRSSETILPDDHFQSNAYQGGIVFLQDLQSAVQLDNDCLMMS